MSVLSKAMNSLASGPILVVYIMVTSFFGTFLVSMGALWTVLFFPLMRVVSVVVVKFLVIGSNALMGATPGLLTSSGDTAGQSVSSLAFIRVFIAEGVRSSGGWIDWSSVFSTFSSCISVLIAWYCVALVIRVFMAGVLYPLFTWAVRTLSTAGAGLATSD